MKIIISCTIIALALISCTDYDINELLAAPEQVDIDGHSFELEARLARDIMPNPLEPEGGDLLAGAYIWSINDDWPAWLDADHIWVIHNDEIWDEKLVDGTGGPTVPDLLIKSAKSEGPKWGPDIYVEVVVQLIDEYGEKHLLRESDAFIYAVH